MQCLRYINKITIILPIGHSLFFLNFVTVSLQQHSKRRVLDEDTTEILLLLLLFIQQMLIIGKRANPFRTTMQMMVFASSQIGSRLRDNIFKRVHERGGYSLNPDDGCVCGDEEPERAEIAAVAVVASEEEGPLSSTTIRNR